MVDSTRKKNSRIELRIGEIKVQQEQKVNYLEQKTENVSPKSERLLESKRWFP